MKNNVPNLSMSPEESTKIKSIRLMLEDKLPFEKIKVYTSANDDLITAALMTDDGEKLKYRGCVGSIEYSEEDKLYYGQVLEVRDLVSYEGVSIMELSREFREAVDDYLEEDHIEALNRYVRKTKQADEQNTWLVIARIFGRIGCIALHVNTADRLKTKLRLREQLRDMIVVDIDTICNPKYYRKYRPYTYTNTEEEFRGKVRGEVGKIGIITKLLEQNVSEEDIKKRIYGADDIVMDAATVWVHYKKINLGILKINSITNALYISASESICELKVPDETKIEELQKQMNISRDLAQEELEIFYRHSKIW